MACSGGQSTQRVVCKQASVTYRLSVDLPCLTPVADAAQAEGVLAGHQSKPALRHLRFRHDFLEADSALDAAVAHALGELRGELGALLGMRLGRLRVVWREHVLLAHLRKLDNTSLTLRATCDKQSHHACTHMRAMSVDKMLNNRNVASSTPYDLLKVGRS